MEVKSYQNIALFFHGENWKTLYKVGLIKKKKEPGGGGGGGEEEEEKLCYISPLMLDCWQKRRERERERERKQM